MSENHHHHQVSGKNLFITIFLNIFITIAQIIGGVMSGSLALLSDAMHNFSDVLALIIAYGANRLVIRPHSVSKTFGYKRAEILATLFNASALIAIAIFLIFESVEKFYNPQAVDSFLVIVLGFLGIIFNSAGLLLLKDDAHKNMNMRAAYLHLLGDVMTSVAVVVGGVLMYYYELYWVDPLVSLFISIYIIWASMALIKESGSVLMQFAPKDIDMKELLLAITKEGAIDNVHHMHLWRLNDKGIHCEAHLDFRENITLEESNKIIDRLEVNLHDNFGIEHTTFQCEYNRCEDKNIIK